MTLPRNGLTLGCGIPATFSTLYDLIPNLGQRGNMRNN